MKVLHVTPSFFSSKSIIGGGEKYVNYLIRALSEGAKNAGMDIDNFCLSFGNCVGTHAVSEDILCEVIFGIVRDPTSIHLPDLLERIKPVDVVIVHGCLSSLGLFIASHARLAGKIVLGFDHGGGESPHLSHTHEVGYLFDRIIAYSKFAASAFQDISVQIKFILGPVDTNYYTPSSASERDPHLIVAVGRLLPHKGFDRIIETLQKPLQLIIAGARMNQEYFKHLQSLIRASPCNIKIEENLSDGEIRALMRRASLFVHASTHVDYQGVFYAKPELLGLSPLEALACGTPTLVSTAGSLGELGSIVGCRTFLSNTDLAILLRSHAESTEVLPSPAEIHESVKSLYGIEQFGNQLIAELNSLRQEV